jgi:hypothetical protein
MHLVGVTVETHYDARTGERQKFTHRVHANV